MRICDKICVLQEGREGPLVAVQCFEEEQGLYVTVNCIAPCTPGVSEFSFQLTYSPYEAPGSMSFGLSKMNRIQKVSFQTPDKDFMFIPHYFLAGRPNLKIKICVTISHYFFTSLKSKSCVPHESLRNILFYIFILKIYDMRIDINILLHLKIFVLHFSFKR